VIFLVVILTVGGAAAASSLLSGQFGRVGSALGWLAQAILYVLGLPVLLLAYLIDPLLSRMQSGMGSLPEQKVLLPTPQIVTADPGDPLLTGPGISFASPEWVLPVLVWLGGLGIVLLLFRRARRQRRYRRSPGVETETIRPETGLFGKLLERVQAAAGGSTRLKPEQQVRAAARIRQVYAELMDRAAQFGSPRARAQTPLEYLPVLAELFARQDRELGLITEAYLRVRYGELPETQAVINQIEAAWKQIQTASPSFKTGGDLES
jgi:hypothetical protein